MVRGNDWLRGRLGKFKIPWSSAPGAHEGRMVMAPPSDFAAARAVASSLFEFAHVAGRLE